MKQSDYSSYSEISGILSGVGINMCEVPEYVQSSVTDIHIAVGQPIILYCFGMNRYTLSGCGIISKQQIDDLVYKMCDYSVYKHTEEMKSGFITIYEKYRCGICGTCVMQCDCIASVRNITSLNIRVPHKINGIADKLIACKDKLLNGVLVIGEPSSGKTTLLSDLVNQIEDKRVVIIDERYEFSAFNLSAKADFMVGYRKSDGIVQAIKSMSPQLVVCDELDAKDLDAVKIAVSTGVSLVASVHGTVGKDLPKRQIISQLIKSGAFGLVVIMKGRLYPGNIHEIYSAGEFCETFGYDFYNI